LRVPHPVQPSFASISAVTVLSQDTITAQLLLEMSGVGKKLNKATAAPNRQEMVLHIMNEKESKEVRKL
jgi:hypothetical protein